jgi:2,4-dienoyl-CoA reductase-like NADH-dependent reductase (Old Yellow Enzyme family)
MATSKLFQPMSLGDILLKHRIVMAPLTRFRADREHVPLPHVLEYYTQRASVPGTLLITEATLIAPRAGGFNNVPGIWSDDQIATWKNVRSYCKINIISLTKNYLDHGLRPYQRIVHIFAALGSRSCSAAV